MPLRGRPPHQRLVLAAAAQHPDGIAVPPPSLPAAPRAMVAKALLMAGLVDVAETAEHDDPSVAWKVDGAPVVLRITEAGRHAIGAAPAGPTDDTAPQPRSESLAASGLDAATDGQSEAQAAQQASSAPQTALARPSLRAAAQGVLAAWDAGGEQQGVPDAIERLRAALGTSTTPRASGAMRQPRPDTKQAAVLALLRRPEGASGPVLIAATGWAPHTVRGFLAGLGKKGITVTVLERVRQVGPNQAGARGSYSIYRIAEVG